ncbi:hypothetical protein RND71_009467 [Anisodus tanguticus]|uniref:Choline monooxygenase, chloroplastic n=1 Tax=Anisodus tanguticus TaxID=243964 RepID=A0AAE1SIC7_9SOLA|nr:hypothetical protein RND71_009467 [Anisodus tanguticus]
MLFTIYADIMPLDLGKVLALFAPTMSSVTTTWMVVIMYHMLIKILEKVSIQRCETGNAEKDQEFDRLGLKALYAFVYPNFMINRYGPWMDTNLVLPQGPRKCLVIFDYFLDASLKGDESFIDAGAHTDYTPVNIADYILQMEDIKLCEAVQRGFESPAYCSGRYAPLVEKAMHRFHCLLYENLSTRCASLFLLYML